ncbi:MAG: Crp/Fnr family transcriptional regulator [candidate division KSB1 bacterium]|nr:Crp/Fnr family transcriptional regulator [candidate division KSB1 bacterium]MDZ7274580.1 Crp/Fnr family transcriptional regulator [candidate division KSB1 bacterium]MDZ7284759.1 Crp/Fnr family transcriptional regulator [candidate division KSB1 bacterium]MDZ7297821.1 Crp/Fnr family transcriptional regulator [candidate division KSB1 bacterium]MDZ7307785.1 Crp/Fnr family transcriptional regulator [candidate division KSB1 bacterium]
MEKRQILQKFPLYRAAPGTLRDQLLQAASSARLLPGEFYFQEGGVCHHIPLVGTGSLRVYKSGERGREITLYHVRPGESCILTAACLLGHRNYPASAVAEEVVEAVLYPAPLFREWIARHEEVRRFVFALLATRLAEVMTLVEEVAFGKRDLQLARFLLERFANQGRPRRTLAVTHEQIAAELGSAREVVSRLLKEFERRGAVALGRRRLHLQNEEVLRRLAEE